MKMLRHPEPRRRRRISAGLRELLRFAQDDKRVPMYALLTVAALARLTMQVAALHGQARQRGDGQKRVHWNALVILSEAKELPQPGGDPSPSARLRMT